MRRTLTRLIAREAEMRRTLKRFIGLFGWMMLVQAFGTASGCDNTAGVDKAPFEPQHFGSAAEFLSIQQDPSDLCVDGTIDVQFSGVGQTFGFPISLAAGDELSADTIGTVGLDTILALYGPADSEGFYGAVPVAADDDGGGNLTSHLTWTAKSTGALQLVVATYDGQGEGLASLHVAVNGTPGCSGGTPGCEVAPTANCAINGSPADCSVAFEISHRAAPGDSARAKCDSLCSSGDTTHLSGIFEDFKTFCHVLIEGLDCSACCTLSDKPVAEDSCRCPLSVTATSPTCTINGSPADCSVAFEISHPAVPGDSPRAKCDSLCSSGDSTHLNGIFGDRTPCQVVIQGLDCNACCGLSDAALAEVPCIVP